MGSGNSKAARIPPKPSTLLLGTGKAQRCKNLLLFLKIFDLRNDKKIIFFVQLVITCNFTQKNSRKFFCLFKLKKFSSILLEIFFYSLGFCLRSFCGICSNSSNCWLRPSNVSCLIRTYRLGTHKFSIPWEPAFRLRFLKALCFPVEISDAIFAINILSSSDLVLL